MAKTNLQTYVANRMDVQFDNKGGAVGAIQNANLSVSFGLDAVSGIGAVTVIEYVPTIARVSVSADQTYLFGQEIDRVQANVGGQKGLLPSEAIESLNGVVFDISAVMKSQTSQQEFGTLWVAESCSLDSGDFSAAKHGTVGRRCQFQALNFHIMASLNSGATGATPAASGNVGNRS
jgi:hypothetical protein